MVSNAGPSSVDGATFVDTIPLALQNVSYVSSALGGALGNSANGTIDGTLTETLTLPANSSVTYTLTGTVASDARGELTNTASIAAPEGVEEGDTDNNVSTDVDLIQVPTTSLRGRVFFDLNANGRQESMSPALPRGDFGHSPDWWNANYCYNGRCWELSL